MIRLIFHIHCRLRHPFVSKIGKRASQLIRFNIGVNNLSISCELPTYAVIYHVSLCVTVAQLRNSLCMREGSYVMLIHKAATGMPISPHSTAVFERNYCSLSIVLMNIGARINLSCLERFLVFPLILM